MMVDKITDTLSRLTAFTLILLVGLILYDATARYLFCGGSTALQELEWHLFDVIILFSIVYALKHNAHVRVDIFYDTFSPKTQALINMLSVLLFVLPLSFLIVDMSMGFVGLSFVQNEASSDPGGLTHRWIVKSLMPLSFGFVALQGISELFKNIKEWRSL